MSPDVHALAGAYAVDALPDDERAFFERHLQACEACRREVDELAATAATLGAAAAEAPPAGLRSRVLAEIDQTRQLPPPQSGGPPGARSPVSRITRLQPLLAAAAAAVLIVVIGFGATTARLLGRIDALETELARTQDITTVMVEPDLQALPVEAPPGTSARLMHSAAGERAILVVDGLAAVPEDRVYQLWVLRDGLVLPDRTFQPGDDGRALIVLEHSVTTGDGVAATLEPAGGSEQPTGDILLHTPAQA